MGYIEEQARKYAERAIKPSKANEMRKAIAAYRRGTVYNAEIIAFLEGAKAQKTMDIEKACKWLSQELIYPTSKDEVEWAELEIEKFRKYMEE